MSEFLHGIVHGKTIELSEALGVPEGQEVEVLVRPLASQKTEWGEGLRRCADALAEEWTEEDDRILDELYQERRRDARRDLPS